MEVLSLVEVVVEVHKFFVVLVLAVVHRIVVALVLFPEKLVLPLVVVAVAPVEFAVTAAMVSYIHLERVKMMMLKVLSYVQYF